jgi:pimeloyl-ACP methyl ester carboxylesterase
MKRLYIILLTSLALFIKPYGASSQNKLPSLPELQFAEIVNKEMFLGDRWSYMEAGDSTKPVMIALHGSGGNCTDWRFQLAGLSKKFRVIAWNAPGYYLTDGFKTETPGCKDFADALNDFLISLKLDKVYLTGNSFGSRVSQCFAMYYPEKVIKMAFIGPSAGFVTLADSTKSKIVALRQEQIKNGPLYFAQTRVNRLVAPGTSPSLIKLISEGMKATNKRAFLQVTSHFNTSFGHSPKEVAEKVKMPILIIAGDKDLINPLSDHAKPLHDGLKNSELVILNNIGHLPHLEEPKKVNNLIQSFFLKD